VNAPTESLEANKATKSDGNSIYIYIYIYIYSCCFQLDFVLHALHLYVIFSIFTHKPFCCKIK
jgi:hypothetical protein